MSANWLAVSSTRVPTWVRTCIRICRHRPTGKKLRPRNGTSRNETRDDDQEADHEHRPRVQRQRQQIAIAAADALEPRLEAALEPHQRIARRRRRSPSHDATCGCSRYFAIVGTSVRDRMNDQIIANITASAIGTNRKRATPLQEEHRHEHDADAQQRDEGRRHDLVGAVQDRLSRPSLPCSRW